MTSPDETVLCQYHYDSLDQLISHALPDIPERQRFYCKSRLATEIQGPMRYSIVRNGDQLLAQQRSEGDAPDTTLLATDQQRSVLQALRADNPLQPIGYSPYGHRPVESGFLSLLGFKGERRDPVTGYYLLGNGYRAFNPVLMRFNSPDSWSPFGKGGLNSYAYCVGDPINQTDPTGHSSSIIFAISKLKVLGRRQRIKTFEKTRSFNGVATNPELTANQVINISDQMTRNFDAIHNIHEHRRALIKFDYNNRNSPNLKNIASDVVANHRLPLDSLPSKLQQFAKTPATPPNSSDLLEVINAPDAYAEHELYKIHNGTSAVHQSGRAIDLNTAKAYYSRIDSIRKSELSEHSRSEVDLYRKLFPPQ